MRVLIVSGIWPPDVGGPASHAPELAEHLRELGYRVEVVVTAEATPAPEAYPVRWVSRRLPRGVRHLRSAWAIARAARAADVVYATGMLGRTAIATRLARRPTVVKLTSDPTFERSLRYRLHGSDLDAFQSARGVRIGVLRRARDLMLARAAHVVVPSASLRGLAIGWGVAPERITLVPNPVAAPADLPDRELLRARAGFSGPTLVFAGRLTPQKSLDVALDALSRADTVSLVLAGDGPEEERLRAKVDELRLGERVRFLGARPRAEVFELLHAADAALLSSSWENFPHMVVEALAVGTPVLATAVGGVTEIVRDGENGLLVPVGDSAALAAAIARYLGDAELRGRLAHAARQSVASYAPAEIYARLIEVLERAARR